MSRKFQDNFKLAIHYIKKKEFIFIEVGSWEGLSSNLIAEYCRKNDFDTKIICIDTWLGSPEHQDSLIRVNGIPNLFISFLMNTKHLKNDKLIYPFPISSAQGAQYLKTNGITADIIYIDAGHEYDSVLLDTKLYWDLLNEGGVMIFDDYSWADVKKAVDEFFSDKNIIKIISETQAIIFNQKTDDHPIIDKNT